MKLNNNHESLLATMATDPLKFVKLCWPDMVLTEKQKEILLSIVDNVDTFVHAANKLGKTRIAAIVAVWFFVSRQPARVIVSSSSESQLGKILWSEILGLLRTTRLQFPIHVQNLQVRKLVAVGARETHTHDYLIGHVTNSVESFQGHHLPNDKPRVLVIFDEASGVSDEFFEASQSWAHRKLVVGNPLNLTNFYFRHCKAGNAVDPAGEAKLLRRVIHIGAMDSPNVQAGILWKQMGYAGSAPEPVPGMLGYPEFVRHKAEWDEEKRKIRLYGHFYEGRHQRLFPDEWLDRSMDRVRWEQLSQEPRRATAMGIDVAQGGKDKTCWTLVDEHGVIAQVIADIPDSMDIAGRTVDFIGEHQISHRRVAIDAGGGGKEIRDRLRENRIDITMVGFGAAAEAKDSYKQRRSELYGELRLVLKRSDKVFALPPDANELRAELAILPMKRDGEGKLTLIPKRSDSPDKPSIERLLRRSPDRADSLALAVFAMRQPVFNPVLDRPIIYVSDQTSYGCSDSESERWRDTDLHDMSDQEIRNMVNRMRGLE